MRNEDEIKRTLDLAYRFHLTEWVAPLKWILGEETLPYLDSDAKSGVMTVMLDGWFNYDITDGRSSFHYYSGGISLCGKWNLIVFGNPGNSHEVAAAEREVKSWRPVGVDIRRCATCERKLRERTRNERRRAARAIR
jgi:hypothetical protein